MVPKQFALPTKECSRDSLPHSEVFIMSFRIIGNALVLTCMSLRLTAAETSWERKMVILTRPGVKLEAPEKEKIAPKTAGVARDLMFQVLKEEKGRLRISSRRQE